MPPTSADLAYERATSHIRSTVRNTLVNDFNTAGAWRDVNLNAFLKRAVPITTGGQRATSQVTATYLRSLLGQSIPWNPSDLIGDGIRGIPPAEIYTRPYHEVWSRLGEGMPLPEAVNLGANRLSSLVNTDMQLAKVRTSEGMIANADGVYGYRRILNGPHPCDYCRMASTQAYHNGNLMPIHSNCSCSVMPITDPLEMTAMTNAFTLGKSGPIASPSSELGSAFNSTGVGWPTELDEYQELARGANVTIPENELDGLLNDVMHDNPSVNLAHLTVNGPQDAGMFSVHARDIPRIEMPQVPETVEGLQPFLTELGRMNVSSEFLSMDPRLLTMTQSQLDSAKVAKLYGYIESGGWREGSVMMTSREGMILDGHHRWAAACASRAHGSTFQVQVLKVDMGIDDLLALAQKFSRAHVGMAD